MNGEFNAVAVMQVAWGDEWDALEATDRARVAADFAAAAREDGSDSREYVRCVGKGNLASYARCLRAGMEVHRG